MAATIRQSLFSRRLPLEHSPHRIALTVLRVFFALAIAAPITCQNEAQPYFSLSSSRTFGSGEKPEIMLSAFGLKAVQIRAYRVNDPVEFVRKMEDLHSFGAQPPRRTGRLTLLERIHNWKRGLRRDIRLHLRGQFTESPRAHLIGKPKPKPAAAPSATHFAAIPVLNKDQLVLSFTQAVTSKNRWSSQQIPVPVKAKGLYLIEAVNGDLRAYTVLMVSDAVLITKVGREHTLGYFVDRATGEPIAASPVAAIVRNGAPEAHTTNADGIADLSPKLTEPEDVKIIARRGSDVALSSIASWTFSNRERNLTGIIYSDRPVYRPGDTAHFRGVIRLREAVGYSTPAGQSVSVQVTDPGGKVVYQKDLSTNTNGILHDKLSLAKDASLGSYYVEAKSGASSVSGSFEVQEYKKPEYEVRVALSQSRVIQGATVPATISARYYFGEPVNGAKVQYSIYRSAYWNSMWYRDEDDDSATGMEDSSGEGGAGEEISQAEGTLDADGNLKVNIPTELSKNSNDFTYRLEARVTDAAGREISGTGWLVATYGSFAVHIEPNRYFFKPNTTAGFKVEARDYDNHPVAVAVHVALVPWDWRKGEAGRQVSTADSATGADGAQNVDLRIPSGGLSFHAVVTARTPEGRTVTEYTSIWVESSGGEFYGEPTQTIQVVPDKKTYRPGDTARILVLAGKANTPVLVAVEGRDIRSHQLIRSSGATALFEYQVTADDEPGFYVSAQFIRQGKLYSGSKLVKIPPEEHKLDFQITTDKKTYLPGQTAHYQVAAFTFDGKPAAHADLSLGVVDEAIYAIRRDTTPELLQFFYGREYDSVYTDSSLTYFFSGEAGTRRMQLAMLRPESSLAQLKPERPPQPKVRKYFPDTAFWAADLTTGTDGRAQADVPFPDSLTTWRATVRGVLQNRFGSSTAKTIVRKNLILRLATPRFFVQGDQVVISGIVHNYLATKKQAKVNVKLAGLDLLSSNAVADLTIPSRAEATIEWRVQAKNTTRQATLTAQAITDEESDALEVQLPVNPPGVPVHQAKGGAILDSGNAAFAFTYPAETVAQSRSLSIRLSPSIAGPIFGALDYLTSFPYGCVEQTMSSFLPNLMVTKAVEELKVKAPGDPAALASKTQAGLDRLYSFQHDDGGWGWWQTDDSHPFMTAYVVAGFAEAKHLGVTIEEDRLTRGVQWITERLTSDESLEPDMRAYMLYALALAGKPNHAAEDTVYSSRNRLSPYGLALLGLTFQAAQDGRAQKLADQVASTAKTSEREAWWPASRDEMLDLEADVTPEATAYVTKLLSRQRPKDPLLPKAALWLVNHRDEGYWWSSSKQTAMVIYGLIDYLKAGHELQPNFTATVKVNGQPTLERTFKTTGVLEDIAITVPDEKLAAGGNRIEVTTSGTGRLYYSLSAEHYSDAARVEKQGAVALNVLRDYYRLAPSKEGDRIVYGLNPLDGPVALGDTLAVRLTVTGSTWRYLVVEDPIPAGTEFIERDNLYEIRNRPPWWHYSFTRRELHDNRMAIFQTYFYEGQQQYFYLLKVVNPGLFHVSPSRVEPMYQPGAQATTESRTLQANREASK